MPQIGRADGRKSLVWCDHFDDLRDPDHASALTHRQPQSFRKWGPEIRCQRVKANCCVLARLEPLLWSPLQSQRRVMTIGVDLWREGPMRSTTGSDGGAAPAFLTC